MVSIYILSFENQIPIEFRIINIVLQKFPERSYLGVVV